MRPIFASLGMAFQKRTPRSGFFPFFGFAPALGWTPGGLFCQIQDRFRLFVFHCHPF